MYVCPNIYLAQQVCLDAQKFGIPYCIIEGSQIPNDFYDGQKILITYSQRVFNGKTIFELDNKSIDCYSIDLDDSHACIDTIRNLLQSEFYNNILLSENYEFI